MIERLPRRGRWAVFAPAARVGRRVFLGGLMATDWETGLAPGARPAPGYPFHHRPLAAQSEVVLAELERALDAVGLPASSVVQLTQWLGANTGDITPWMEARARRLPEGGFASIAAGARRLPVAGAAVCVDAVADGAASRVPIAPAGRPFPAGVRAGNVIYLSGELATDWRGDGGSGVAADARVDPSFWYGHPVRAQTELILRRLAALAKEAGSDLARTARATVFLSDHRDQGVLDEAWRARFGEGGPARTVVSGCALAARGCVVEVAVDVLAGAAPEPVPVAGMAHPPAPEPPAVVADGLVHVSGQMAVGPDGADPRGLPDPVFGDVRAPVAEQLKIVLERLDRILRAAGGGLDDVVSARLYLPDLRRLGTALPAWREAFGDSPPTGSAIGVGPLPVAGCEIMVDAIAAAR